MLLLPLRRLPLRRLPLRRPLPRPLVLRRLLSLRRSDSDILPLLEKLCDASSRETEASDEPTETSERLIASCALRAETSRDEEQAEESEG